ncbi:helix-turn-helix domain-containing protein [Elizabethkingia anophelis]|nr:helix-turn-helix domain-containing protein [Elizabethkingia anophelis]
MKISTPDYKRIYKDIIDIKYPDKKTECEFLLNKPNLSVLDVIELNIRIFGIVPNRSTEIFNQKLRSYRRADILKILDYQKEHRLNNSQLAKHFKVSRNTLAKWKKLFLV